MLLFILYSHHNFPLQTCRNSSRMAVSGQSTGKVQADLTAAPVWESISAHVQLCPDMVTLLAIAALLQADFFLLHSRMPMNHLVDRCSSFGGDSNTLLTTGPTLKRSATCHHHFGFFSTLLIDFGQEQHSLWGESSRFQKAFLNAPPAAFLTKT